MSMERTSAAATSLFTGEIDVRKIVARTIPYGFLKLPDIRICDPLKTSSSDKKNLGVLSVYSFRMS
jgi:hypothetical protein